MAAKNEETIGARPNSNIWSGQCGGGHYANLTMPTKRGREQLKTRAFGGHCFQFFKNLNRKSLFNLSSPIEAHQKQF
jgi:hypothetical protein